MINKSLNRYDLLLFLLFAYLIVGQLYAIWPFTIDDMYIPLRYAKHWVAGDGLLWNKQMPPVEGYSSFTFLVLGSLALLLQIDPIVFLKAAGCVGLLFTLIAIYWLGRFWLDRQLAFIPCIGLLLYQGQVVWAVSGLETTVYEALICGAVYCVYRGLGYEYFPQQRRLIRPFWISCSGFLLAIAGMTRPEAPAFMMLFLIVMVWDKPKETRNYFASLRAFLIPLIGIYLPYFIWRWHYYGYLFPNTIYCKGLTQEMGVQDVAYLKLIWIFILCSIPAFLTKDKRSYFLFFPSLVYLILLVSADPVVSFFNRLYLPAFALLLVLAAWGLQVGVEGLKIETSSKRPLYIFLSLCMYIFFVPFMTYSGYRYFSENPQMGEQLRSQVITWLKANTHSEDRVVLGDSGKIPYEVSAYFIDSFCLNNLEMAHSTRRKRDELFCEQVLKEKPHIVITESLRTPRGEMYHGADQCLKKNLPNSDYQWVQTFSDHKSDSYIYTVYKKR